MVDPSIRTCGVLMAPCCDFFVIYMYIFSYNEASLKVSLILCVSVMCRHCLLGIIQNYRMFTSIISSNLIKYLNDEDMNLKAVGIMQVLKKHLMICRLYAAG